MRCAACSILHSWLPIPDCVQTPSPLPELPLPVPLPLQVTTILLKEYRTQFQGAPLSSSYNYLKQLMMSQLPNNPIITHETDAKHLRDPAFLGAALK
jgi:hypothetical protein